MGKKISRRTAVGTGAAVGAAVAGLVVGGAAGYLAHTPSSSPGSTTTVTQGGTGATSTVTSTVTTGGTGTGNVATNLNQLNIGMNISGGDSTDPTVSFTLVCDYVCTQCYEGLVRVEYPNTIPNLRLAKSINVASDGVTWTATLADGIKFATGDPITANDFVYSWGRAIELGAAATAATDWMVGTMGLKDPSQITAPSSNTVQFVTGTAIAPSTVMGLLATTPFVVLNQKQTEANTQTMTVTSSNGTSSSVSDHGMAWLQNNSAGSGAYVLKQWVKNTNFTLAANTNYWGSAPNGPAHIPNILIQHVADPTTEVNGLNTGTYDIAWDPTPQQAQSLFWGPSTAVQENLQPRLYYLWLNAAAAPFNNPAVCNALKWAIDYNGIVNDVLEGFGQVWQTISFPNLPGADPSTPYSYDPAKAKSMLAAAGYPNGFSMTIYEANDQLTQGVVETIQSNLSDVGVTSTINNQPIATTISEAEQGQIQSFVAGWGGGLASLANLIPAWTDINAGSICKWFGWNDAMAQSLTKQWYAAPDDATAATVAKQLTTYCLSNAPVVVIFDIEAQIAQRSWVGGFYIPNPEIFVDMSHIYKLPVTSS